jgi:hypothetical protein
MALNCDHVRIPTASSICWTGLACFHKFMNYGKECFGQPSIAHSKFYKDLQMYNNSSSIATSCILRLAANLVERECIIYLPTTLTIHTYYIQPFSAKSSQIPVHTLGPPIYPSVANKCQGNSTCSWFDTIPFGLISRR